MKKTALILLVLFSSSVSAAELTLDCVVSGNVITSFDKSLLEKQHVTVEINDNSELYSDPKIAPTFISILGTDDLSADVWSWESPKNKRASLIENNSTKSKFDIRTVIKDGGESLDQSVVINRATGLLTVSKTTITKSGKILVSYSGTCQQSNKRKF